MSSDLSRTAELAQENLPESVEAYDSIYHIDGVYVEADDEDIGQVMAFIRHNGLKRDGLRRRFNSSRLAGWIYDPENSEPGRQ